MWWSTQILAQMLFRHMRLTAAVVLFLPAGKDKKGCTALPRVDQDTSLFPTDEKAVEYYFASDARSVWWPEAPSPPCRSTCIHGSK